MCAIPTTATILFSPPSARAASRRRSVITSSRWSSIARATFGKLRAHRRGHRGGGLPGLERLHGARGIAPVGAAEKRGELGVQRRFVDAAAAGEQLEHVRQVDRVAQRADGRVLVAVAQHEARAGRVALVHRHLELQPRIEAVELPQELVHSLQSGAEKLLAQVAGSAQGAEELPQGLGERARAVVAGARAHSIRARAAQLHEHDVWLDAADDAAYLVR
jgi:hypothetical protein